MYERAQRDVSRRSDFRSTTMLDGRTGEPLRTAVFLGFKEFQTLKQIASWKKSMRGPNGPRTLIGRTPTRGRQYGGGLRWGTQERALAISLGTCALQQESLRTLSSPATAHVCYDCGGLARHNDELNLYRCDACAAHEAPPGGAREGKGGGRVVPVPVSYMLLHVIHELAAMNVSMRLVVEPARPAAPAAAAPAGPLLLPSMVVP